MLSCRGIKGLAGFVLKFGLFFWCNFGYGFPRELFANEALILVNLTYLLAYRSAREGLRVGLLTLAFSPYFGLDCSGARC